MRLSDLFAHHQKLAFLINEARAVDELQPFAALVAQTPVEPRHLRFWRAIRASAFSFAERAGGESETLPDQSGPPCFAGQQPYVDYYPAVLAKLDALEASHCGSFYAFADYAPFGSDPWMARTQIPSVSAGDGLLRLLFYRTMQAHQSKDLRFVPPPDAAAMADLAEKLKGMITHTAKWLPQESFSKKAAYARLRLLLRDYEAARCRARNAGEFNSFWSARIFHRLGFRLPLVSLSELLAQDELLPTVAATLSVFIKHNALFIESVEEALRFDDGNQLNFSTKSPGHVPLALADRQSGVRRCLRLKRRGADWLLMSGAGTEEVFNIGGAEADTLAELLRRLAGRWSLDVFAPLFLFRLGVAGIINGRGSIRYSLVMAHVFKRLFGERPAPNLLCSCCPRLEGPFVEAVCRAHGRLPELLRTHEPTLIARLLYAEESQIREEIADSWRDGVQR
jgi:hypothetical protein